MSEQVFDTVIHSGVYPDFQSGTLVPATIAISCGKIAAILPPEMPFSAKQVIDAKGHVVSPGFIDLHMHEEDFLQEERSYNSALFMVRMGVTTAVGGNCGVMNHRYKEFKAIVDELGGSPVNYVLLTGYNSLREQAGIGWYDAAPEEKQKAIHEIIRQEIADGSWGVTFGLEYAPGITSDEMTAAVLAVQDSDPFVAIHYRADCEGCLSSLEEMAKLCRDTDCRVQISHLSSLGGPGHMMEQSLAYLEKEIAANPKLGYDTYPYDAFCTGIGTAAFDEGWRERWGVDYDIVMLLHEPYKGVRCDKALYEKVRRETPKVNVVCFAMDEDSIRQAVAHPMGLLGSDGILSNGKEGHPRIAGTFPRILGKYVREEKALTLMDALDKMTHRAADRIGLTGKGRIAPGYDADITIFDPDTILDGPDWTDLSIPNVGIDYVLVGGNIAVDHNNVSPVNYGKVLDRK